MSENAIELKEVTFYWPGSDTPTLTIPSLSLPQKAQCLIQGASGVGKTTLLHLLCGLLPAKSGEVRVLGTDLTQLKEWQKDRFRADHIGVMFQQFNLLSYLSVEQNILLPLRFSKVRADKEPHPLQQMDHLMDALGLPRSIKSQPVTQLSIGQQQRVAAARALMGRPELFIADEPTSALDSDNRDRFVHQLFSAANEMGTTVVFVSHDPALKSYFAQQIELKASDTGTVMV